MSNLAVEWAETFPVKDTYERIILMKLARHADNDGTDTWPSVTTLAKCAMCDTETVRRRLRSLQQRGVLTRGDQGRVAHHHAGQRPIVYDLLIPRSWYSDAQWEKIQEERTRAGEDPIDPDTRPDIKAPDQRGRAKRSDIGVPNPKRKPKQMPNSDPPLTEEGPLTEGGGHPPLREAAPPSNRGEYPPLTEVPPPSVRGTNPSLNPSKESLQEPSPPTPPQESSGAAVAADPNEGGGEALIAISDVLPDKPVADPHPEPSPKPGTEVATRNSGGELVTLHGYDADQVVTNWTADLERSGGDVSAIAGRLRINLVKGVREILAGNPRCDEQSLIDALDEYMRNGKTPKYLPIAHEKVLQERARSANPRLQESNRERFERQHHERVLEQRARGEDRKVTPLSRARSAAWSASFEQVPTLQNRTLWCEPCDNTGWLPREQDERGFEVGPARRCQDCQGGQRQFQPSRAEVTSYARREFSERFRATFGVEPDVGDVVDAEIVD